MADIAAYTTEMTLLPTHNYTEKPPHNTRYLALLLLIIPFLTICGNILVVLSILRERSLKTITNYFIFNLAVADFLVALLVMPFAVYIEVAGGWYLEQTPCNIYIACDVCASTASILNLLAISLDRYIAITRPIHYSRMGKNKCRAAVTIVLVWVISIAIALPIIFGVNPFQNEEVCEFTNPTYSITSSICSFYLPCFLMIVLYGIILKRLRERQKMAAARKARRAGKGGGAQKPSGLATHASALLGGAKLFSDISRRLDTVADETTTTLEDEMHTGTLCSLSSSDEERQMVKCQKSDHMSNSHNQTSRSASALASISDGSKVQTSATVVSDGSAFIHSLSDIQEDISKTRSFGEELEQIPFIDDNNSRPPSIRSRDTGDRIETLPAGDLSLINGKRQLCSLRKKSCATESILALRRNFVAKLAKLKQMNPIRLRLSTNQMARKEHRQIRKEQKATQTLAVVLVVFLLCWVPFFTCHLVNSLCHIMADGNCVPFIAFFITTWLGYMNSFMNPIIYTIFNPEYRKAFRKLLLCTR